MVNFLLKIFLSDGVLAGGGLQQKGGPGGCNQIFEGGNFLKKGDIS